MDINRAKEILKDSIKEDGGLYSLGAYLAYDFGDDVATLDGSFDLENLEAIVCYMRNSQKP